MTPDILSCGSCTLCCKVMAVTEIDKPRGVWCGDCDKGVGCRVYADRPPSCAEFDCVWLQSQSQPSMKKMAPELRPDRCHVVLTSTAEDGPYAAGLVAHVDPVYPDAWKNGAIGRMLTRARDAHLTVIVACGDKRHGFLAGEVPISFTEDQPGTVRGYVEGE